MKKLNRKGFTLVELLAVIIILAIVVGISIPAVLTTTNNAKKKAFDTALASTTDWVERQYQVAVSDLSETGVATLDSSFRTVCGGNGATCAPSTAAWIDGTNLIAAAGLATKDIQKIELYVNPNTGRACVKLTAKSNGNYSTGGTALTPIKSTACGASLS